MALLSEVARLPLICFLHHPSGVALVHVAQEEPLHICLTASREGREGGLVAHPSREGTALPASGRYTCYFCLYPHGQEHVSTQLAGRRPCAQMSITGSVILGERRVSIGGPLSVSATVLFQWGTVVEHSYSHCFCPKINFPVDKLLEQAINILKIAESHSCVFSH